MKLIRTKEVVLKKTVRKTKKPDSLSWIPDPTSRNVIAIFLVLSLLVNFYYYMTNTNMSFQIRDLKNQLTSGIVQQNFFVSLSGAGRLNISNPMQRALVCKAVVNAELPNCQQCIISEGG